MNAPPPEIPAIEPKPWWRSRALVGALVVMGASLARLALPGLEIDTHALTEALLDLLALLGAALAWWGRVRASQPVRFRRAGLAAARPSAGADAGDPWGRERMHGAPVERLPSDPGAGPSGPGRASDGFWESRHDDGFFPD